MILLERPFQSVGKYSPICWQVLSNKRESTRQKIHIDYAKKSRSPKMET